MDRDSELQQRLFDGAVGLPPERWRDHLLAATGGDLELVEAVLARLLDHANAAGTRAAPPDPGGEQARTSPAEAKLASLRARPSLTDVRYTIGEEVGRGGMGSVVRVRDLDLGRDLAMKRMREDRSGPAADVDSTAQAELAQRFLGEAQIAGQLDHPGVVPVHEIGIDPTGRIYFTMRLVRGQTADVVFAAAREGTGEWTRTRALEVLLKVCDTMAFAHAKGVLHRDLKPSNVMVGRYGEVYVVDWGLAKVRGEPGHRDPGPRQAQDISQVKTDRSADDDPGSPLLTMDGTPLGTPSYMPPEQAEGRIEQLDERADVYAIGAMLYELLTGCPPYVPPGARIGPLTIRAAVLAGPPTPVHLLDRGAPAELVAICDKAMARNLDERYADISALARDMRAYLDHRVVAAYRTGPIAELRKWTRRNRGAAAGLLAAALAAVTGGTLTIIAFADAAQSDAHAARADADRLQAEVETLRERQAKTEIELEARRQRVATQVQQQRTEEWSRRADAVREVVTLADRLQIAEAEIVQLARFAASDGGSAAPVADPIGTLDGTARAIAGTTEHDFGPWARGRWLTIRGRPDATTILTRGTGSDVKPPRPATGGAPQLPLAPRLLVDAVYHRALAEAHAVEGDAERALTEYLAALDGFRATVTELGMERPDRRPPALNELTIGTARDTARIVAELQPSTTPGRRVDDWLEARSKASRSRSNQPTTPEETLVRAARRIGTGAIAGALADLRGLSDSGSVDLLAAAQLRLGLATQALTTVRSAGPAATAVQQHVRSMTEARCLLAQHRPQEALDELDQHLSRLPTADWFPHLRREALILHAVVKTELGDLHGALHSLEQGAALLAPSDAANRRSLERRRAVLLDRLGQPAAALAACLGRAPTGAEDDLEGLTPSDLRSVVELAARAGFASLEAPALERQAGEGWRSTSERVRWLMARSNLLRRRGRPAEAEPLDAEIRERLEHCSTGVAMRARVHLAALARETDASAALAELGLAAELATTRLIDYGRCLPAVGTRSAAMVGEPTLAQDGQLALDGLAAIDWPSNIATVATAWAVVQACGDLDLRLRLTRPAKLPESYENARAGVLDRQWQRFAAYPDDDRPAGSFKDLSNREEQLRMTSGVHAAAFPRPVPLSQAQRALGPRTAFVTVVPASPRSIALIVTATAAALLHLPSADGLAADLAALGGSEAEVRTALDRLGDAWLDPLLHSPVFATAGEVTTLLFAVSGALTAVPFEWCTLPDRNAPERPREPLLARFDVAYAPSVTAWFEQARTRGPARGAGNGPFQVLIDPAREHAAVAAWSQAALSRRLTVSRDQGALETLLHAGTTDTGSQLHVRLTTDAGEPDVLIEAGKCSAVVWTAALHGTDLNPRTSWFACGTSGPVGDGRLTLQDVRDLGGNLDFVLLQNARIPASRAAEAEAFAAFAQAFWVGGAAAVVTVSGTASTVTTDVVDAMVKARQSGQDGLTAWCEAMRTLQRTHPAQQLLGVRAWLSPR